YNQKDCLTFQVPRALLNSIGKRDCAAKFSAQNYGVQAWAATTRAIAVCLMARRSRMEQYTTALPPSPQRHPQRFRAGGEGRRTSRHNEDVRKVLMARDGTGETCASAQPRLQWPTRVRRAAGA